MSEVPYVENFPRYSKLPDHMIKCLKTFGNTVISKRRINQLGWNGVQYLCAKHGLKVTVTKTEYNNYIIEVIKRAKR